MIVYELRCGSGHGFDAWFRNSDAYDQQRSANQISCPLCGDLKIAKAPMAPRISKGGRSRTTATTVERSPAEYPAAAPGLSPPGSDQVRPNQAGSDQLRPEHLRLVMSKIAELNRHITETCDYVGDSFPEEARKIHYGETPRREIYGEASPAEAAELQEEGIAIAAIPWLKRTDS
jgi:hypothetical protein